MNGFLTLDWSNVKSAVIYGILTSIVTFLIVIGSGILTHGSIYGINWTVLIDKGAIAVIGVLVTIVSLFKNLLTNNQGKFLGFLDVIPDKDPTEKE